MLIAARDGFEIRSRILGCEISRQGAGLIASGSFVSGVLDKMSIPSQSSTRYTTCYNIPEMFRCESDCSRRGSRRLRIRVDDHFMTVLVIVDKRWWFGVGGTKAEFEISACVLG